MRALRAVGAAFVVFGIFGGAWAVAAADIEHSFGLSDGQLGFLLAGGIIAATVIAAFGGAITDRWGARAVLTRALVAWALFLTIEAASFHLPVFVPAFIVAVAAGGLIDVVMNVIAAHALSARPGALVRFHGLFNAGAVLGAIATGVVLRAGATWRVMWFGIAVLAVVTAVLSHRSPMPEPPRTEHPSMVRALLGLRKEGLAVLALVFGAAAMVEGGIGTWGVLYLRDRLHTGVVAGVGAYVAGQLLATATRMGGGGVIGVLGTRRSIALGGALACGGLVAEAVARNVAVAATGLTAAAVGISVVWPLLLADVNNEARHPSLAIGGVTAAGYLGMVAGPPLVGTISNVFGLRVGLLVLAGIAAFVALTPSHIRTRTPA
jgi:MFS family permease